MKQLSPLRAIGLMCKQCNGWPENTSWKTEIENCIAKDCALYPYKGGKLPKKELTPAQKENVKILQAKYGFE